MTDLGGGSVTVTLITRAAEAELKKFEATASASLKRISVAAEGVISKDAFRGSVSGAKLLDTALDPLKASFKTLTVDGSKLGDGVGKGAVAAVKQLNPMRDTIRSVSNELKEYQLRLETSDGAQNELAAGISNVVKQARTLRDSVAQNST